MTKLFDWTNEQWQEYSDYIFDEENKKVDNSLLLAKVTKLRTELKEWNGRKNFIVDCLTDYQRQMEKDEKFYQEALKIESDEDKKVILKNDIFKCQDIINGVDEFLISIGIKISSKTLTPLEDKKEVLRRDIAERLSRYSVIGLINFDIESEYNQNGVTERHWGGSRGDTWEDYLAKIDRDGSGTEFAYESVEGGLLYCLAQTLFPYFLVRYSKKQMRKKEIQDYMRRCHTLSEQAYYDNKDPKLSTEKTVSEVIAELKR